MGESEGRAFVPESRLCAAAVAVAKPKVDKTRLRVIITDNRTTLDWLVMIRASIGALAVAVLALLATMSSYKISEQAALKSPDPFRIADSEVRFAPALELIPSSGVIGYITDMPVGERTGVIALMSTQYAAAPRALVPVETQKPEWAIGNFDRQGDYAALGLAAGYTLVRDCGRGAVVYRRSR